MGTTRRVPNIIVKRLEALEAANNELVANLRRTGNLGLHYEARAAVGTATATNTATAVTRLNACKAAYNLHRVDLDEHLAADTTNATAAADATDEASGITLANELKADLNAHIVLQASHIGHVGGVAGLPAPAVIATADASDEATLVALANAIHGALNRHTGSALRTIELVAS